MLSTCSLHKYQIVRFNKLQNVLALHSFNMVILRSAEACYVSGVLWLKGWWKNSSLVAPKLGAWAVAQSDRSEVMYIDPSNR